MPIQNTSLTCMLAHGQPTLQVDVFVLIFMASYVIFSIFLARARALSLSLARLLARYLPLARALTLTRTGPAARNGQIQEGDILQQVLAACVCVSAILSTVLDVMGCLRNWLWPRRWPRQFVCEQRACACMSPAYECCFFEREKYIQYSCSSFSIFFTFSIFF